MFPLVNLTLKNLYVDRMVSEQFHNLIFCWLLYYLLFSIYPYLKITRNSRKIIKNEKTVQVDTKNMIEFNNSVKIMNSIYSDCIFKYKIKQSTFVKHRRPTFENLYTNFVQLSNIIQCHLIPTIAVK